jgi:PHP family Zn ribbon phosphoesterase
MLPLFKADLHVHTCLSPCADLSMGPRAIVEQAVRNRLDLIGVCDHNSSENAGAVMEAAQGRQLRVLPGMEVTSKEEVHVLGLFDELEPALEWQTYVYAHLPGENDPEVFGLQPVVNAEHEVLGFNPRLLAGATELSVEQIVDGIRDRNGLAIAAHVDREAFGLLGQLGFVPTGLRLDALELSAHATAEQVRNCCPGHAAMGMVRASDAHSLEQIGQAATWFALGERDTGEIRKALRGQEGRRALLAEASADGWHGVGAETG